MKKILRNVILIVLLCACLVFSFTSCKKTVTKDDNGIVYELSMSGKSYTVIGYTGEGTAVVIPDTVEGIPVTRIAKRAFRGNDSIVSVSISENIKRIGLGAFSDCDSLYVVYNNSHLSIELGSEHNGDIASCAKVVVDNGVPSCENKYTLTSDGFLFEYDGDAYALIAYIGGEKNVKLPNNVNGSSYKIHNMRGVIGVTVPEGVKNIGNYAFAGCPSLATIVIPDSVTMIGDHAFDGCVALTDIEVSSGNANYKSVDGNLYSKDGKTLIRYAVGKKDESFTTPDSVTAIDNGAFWSCDNLISVVIGNDVTSVGGGAFYDCNSLASVAIGNNVATIGSAAFYRCTSLVNVTVPDSVTAIGNGAFRECKNLRSVVFGNGITEINDNMFSDCTGLTDIVIPDSVTKIGDAAFFLCWRIKNVYYTGTSAEWSEISIGDSHILLTNANRYYYSETEPQRGGNYWHFVDGKIVVW